MTRRVLFTFALLVAVCCLAGCTPPDGLRPDDNRPPNRGPVATVPAAGGYDIYLEVEVLGPRPARRVYTRPVSITMNVIQTDGRYAIYTDPNTGQTARGPIPLTRATPVHYGVSFTPGIAFVEAIVIYLGYEDEQLSCWFERDGVEIPGTRDREVIGPTVSGRGGARSDCHYAPA